MCEERPFFTHHCPSSLCWRIHDSCCLSVLCFLTQYCPGDESPFSRKTAVEAKQPQPLKTRKSTELWDLAGEPNDIEPSDAENGGEGSGATKICKSFLCQFATAGVSSVEVQAASPKRLARMREKLAKYSPPHPRGRWPLAANILDPVRASGMCQSSRLQQRTSECDYDSRLNLNYIHPIIASEASRLNLNCIRPFKLIVNSAARMLANAKNTFKRESWPTSH